MKPAGLNRTNFLAVAAFLAAMFSFYPSAQADPSHYPEFAQQSLPANVTPSFISIDELVEDVKAGKKPLIIDVRSEEEFREVHILSALSAPLAQFKAHLPSIPRDRPVVLY
ncbi:MAG: rhodanese-like domain-containing protein [Deltaproteobacteria bacterium]|nr:rhodanese-like domain-containing protein [Deltaproteobacteria bacterium]MBI2183006.1 rhodanese-like domain-containing protein [Deltaproteobacteria bacterium]MBI2364458.1 rhodanese-like domain-containing protein [Deltaproteobacteria bacterium]MBI2532731.1 rhodanese-like domain-containing protein [Deltaproteobacteria bacterium]MBI3066885.1 rhodanese-like domain-containing protein [Deltaproteobacteria bacterium]